MELSSIVLYVIIPILLSLVGYIRRIDVERIAKLEAKVDTTMSDVEVRQLLVDKLEPVTEDLKEIKVKMDKVIDHLLKIR